MSGKPQGLAGAFIVVSAPVLRDHSISLRLGTALACGSAGSVPKPRPITFPVWFIRSVYSWGFALRIFDRRGERFAGRLNDPAHGDGGVFLQRKTRIPVTAAGGRGGAGTSM